jgi:hypothetical protein
VETGEALNLLRVLLGYAAVVRVLLDIQIILKD